jgi:hypothetical protein
MCGCCMPPGIFFVIAAQLPRDGAEISDQQALSWGVPRGLSGFSGFGGFSNSLVPYHFQKNIKGHHHTLSPKVGTTLRRTITVDPFLGAEVFLKVGDG